MLVLAIPIENNDRSKTYCTERVACTAITLIQ